MTREKPSYAAEYRQQMVELVRGGRTARELAREFGCAASTIRSWVRQADGRRRTRPVTGRADPSGGHHPTGRHAAAYCFSAPNAPLIS